MINSFYGKIKFYHDNDVKYLSVTASDFSSILDYLNL